VKEGGTPIVGIGGVLPNGHRGRFARFAGKKAMLEPFHLAIFP